MGWLGKTLAVIFGLMLFGLGIWQLGILIFAILLVPPVLRGWIRKGKSPASQGLQGNGRPRGKFTARYVVGGLLLLLAFAAFESHGILSPFVLGSLGILVLAWGRVRISILGSALRPVDESILLRSSPIPVSWVAVAEVKPLTRDLGRAMAGVNGAVLISASDTPSIYVVVVKGALTERSAEAAIVETLKETALSLSALGAYLLPLDSKQASAFFQPSFEVARIGDGDWSQSVASGTYDLISIRQEKGFARSLGLHRRVNQGREGKGRIPSTSQEFAHPPFLAEAYKAIGNRLTWPSPDQYTAFLSSLMATSGEPVGTRIVDAGGAPQSQMVLVRSQGSPSVELSRAQLRAVVRMYDKGTR
jgi:hypothetical protein